MKNEKILQAIGEIDDELVYGAVNDTKKNKTILAHLAKPGTIAACLCFVIIGIAMWNNTQTQQANSGNTLLGADKIYPTIMVQGRLYEWRKGTAICNSLPNDCSYYGDLVHVEGEKPNYDSEFVSVFLASGQIYTVLENDSVIYLCLTTDWLNNTVVVFDYVESKD